MGKGGVQLLAPGTRTPGSAFEDRGPPNLCHPCAPLLRLLPGRVGTRSGFSIQDRWDGVGRMDRVRAEDWGMPAVLGTLFTLPPPPIVALGAAAELRSPWFLEAWTPLFRNPRLLVPTLHPCS